MTGGSHVCLRLRLPSHQLTWNLTFGGPFRKIIFQDLPKVRFHVNGREGINGGLKGKVDEKTSPFVGVSPISFKSQTQLNGCANKEKGSGVDQVGWGTILAGAMPGPLGWLVSFHLFLWFLVLLLQSKGSTHSGDWSRALPGYVSKCGTPEYACGFRCGFPLSQTQKGAEPQTLLGESLTHGTGRR